MCACIQGMLLREVQGEVLALRQEQVSTGSSTSGSQQQPSTLTRTSSPGSGSGPRPLLRRTPMSSSSNHRACENRSYRVDASAGATEVRRELALEESDPVHDGSGMVRKGFKTASDTSKADDTTRRSEPHLSSSLPSFGWEIAKDDAGNRFYSNAITGESRWDPPAPDEVDKSARSSINGDEEQGLPEARGGGYDMETASEEGRAHEHEASKEQPDALPAGWEAIDTDNRGVYYHHVASGVTQWEVPKEEYPASGTAAVAARLLEGDGEEEPIGGTSTAPTGGRAGWEEFKTEEGVQFWYNDATGESCWELPNDCTE